VASWVALLLLAGCGADLAASLPGVYVLDRDAYRRVALERRRSAQGGLAEGVSGPARRALEARLAQEAGEEAASVRIRLELHAGGTFEVVYRYGDEQGHGRGAWEVVEGEVRLTTSEADGRPLAQPFEVTAEVAPGGLVLRGPRVPVPMPLLRAATP
jgi:hypothetical protein